MRFVGGRTAAEVGDEERHRGWTASITVALPYDEAVTRTCEALAEQGLGACNPELAHQALEVDRRIGVLLPDGGPGHVA